MLATITDDKSSVRRKMMQKYLVISNKCLRKKHLKGKGFQETANDQLH